MPAPEHIQQFLDQVKRVVLGKEEMVETIAVVLLSEGHVLIEDVPGTGKTVLSHAVAKALGLPFKRIQMTPDLLPSDLAGSNVLDVKTGQFTFHPGPLFASVVLADEINRATPKTLSAMLEAMEEGQVTVDGTTHPLPKPFLVIATQNPVEHEGVFPLPYAQVDRFAARVDLGYLTRETEMRMLADQALAHPLESVEPVMDQALLLELIAQARAVHESEAVRGYVVDLAAATRHGDGVMVGASSRGAISLSRAARARAWIHGRDHVLPDDVKALAVIVLGHRVIDATGSSRYGPDRVREVVREIPVPVP